MQRVQRSLQNIDKKHLSVLMRSIHALVQEYETLHSSIFAKDKTTLNQMHGIEELEKSSTQPPVTYYLILKNLFDTLMAAKARKHGEEKPILALYRLLTDELRELEEAQLEHPEDSANIDASLDGALQRLVKHIHPMRDRTTLTQSHLEKLLREIDQHTTVYEKSLRLLSKEHETVKLLKSIVMPENSRNTLDAYCQILKKLHMILRASKKAATTPSLQALHKLLVLELQTQAESEWSEPCEDNGYRNDTASIDRSLQNIDEHSFYSSKKDKEFCEKWSISLSHRAIGVAEEWKAVCELALEQNNAGLQQLVNHAVSMLGFTDDKLTSHKNKYLFALQKEPFAKEVRELETERKKLADIIRYRKKEASKIREKTSEAYRNLELSIQDAQTNLAIIDDNIRDCTVRSLDHQIAVFPLESETLHQLSESILLFSKNMGAFVIENMLREKAQTGGKLSEEDIQHCAKVYYLFLSKLQTLHAPIVSEYNRINSALEKRIDIAYQGRGELETAKAKITIAFHTVPVFPKMEFTHNLEECRALLTSGDDDYYNFKKFLTTSFSLLETPEEFQMVLNSLTPKANMNKLNHIDFTVSEKYHVTFMSQHRINSTPANIATVAQPEGKAEASDATLHAAINSPLPGSAPVSVGSDISFPSSDSVDPGSVEREVDIIETTSQSSSPRSGTTTDHSEFKPERKPSFSEAVMNFVANDALNRPRPTWQKIGIGCLIGLAAGLVAGGIAAATMVTGGVALGIVIGVSVGLLAAGVTTGTIGGKIHDYRTRPVEATQPSLKRRSSSADIQSQLEQNVAAVAKKVKTETISIRAVKPRDQYSVAKSQFSQFIKERKSMAIPVDVATSQPRLV